MPIWLVKATWNEDEAEASEQWEVSAVTAHDAVKAATAHIRFPPRHVEARLRAPETESEAGTSAPHPGRARQRSPTR